MRAPIFKNEFKPITAKRKKELDGLVNHLKELNRDPKFRAAVEELKAHHRSKEAV